MPGPVSGWRSVQHACLSRLARPRARFDDWLAGGTARFDGPRLAAPHWLRKLVWAAAIVGTALGCSSDHGSDPDPGDGDGPDQEPADSGAPACTPNSIRCEVGEAVHCDARGKAQRTDCMALGQSCTPDLGCTLCAAGERSCVGETSQRCADDGASLVVEQVCNGEAGVHCDANSGSCLDLCAEARAEQGYLGCEYWAVSMANSVTKDEFDYALVVSNPQAVAADLHITAITDAYPAFSADERLEPGTVKTLRLPWRLHAPDGTYHFSGAAYHITSTVPVTAYQFNPLEYRQTGDCSDPEQDDDPADDACYSFSNDASLLLPSHSLGSDYMVLGYPAGLQRTRYTTPGGTLLEFNDGSPAEILETGNASIAIVALSDGPIRVTPTAPATALGIEHPAGTSFEISGVAGLAYQIFFEPQAELAGCPAADRGQDQASLDCGGSPCVQRVDACRGRDFSGTRIESAGKLAVYVGAPCANVPFDRDACDHLEEALPPLDTWGTHAVIAATRPLYGEPNLFRILSASDANTITFEPEVHAPVTLAAGEVFEFQSDSSFEARGSAAFLTAQLLVGQDFDGLEPAIARFMDGVMRNGDPSLSYVAPVEQFRNAYEFLSPETFEQSWALITVPRGRSVRLDGKTVADFEPVGDGEFAVSHVRLSPGAHVIRSDAFVGLQVYGFGSYTSYMFPGGLNLRPINIF